VENNPKQTGVTAPPEPGAIPRHIPRGLEVLIKKAAVDPAFKKVLFEKRAEAAKALGLKLTPAEEAMLAVVPLPQLEGIVAHTRVSPGLRPAFLGYAAGAMVAALAATTSGCTGPFSPAEEGIRPDPPPKTLPWKADDSENAAKQRAEADEGITRGIRPARPNER
jgi:hypothetical protein